MKILITGSNGYIASRLIPILAQENHQLVLLVRDLQRLHLPQSIKTEAIQADLLKAETLQRIPKDIDAAYYFVHSMSQSDKDFNILDKKAAENFKNQINQTQCKQIIYLSGIQNSMTLSKHLQSRLAVEKILQSGSCPVTVLRAAIIIGSGSASFEIMRDLVEKLPIMIAPRWVKSLCQPISIHDVLYYLQGVVGKKECMGKVFDIGGPNILTYKQMLLQMAQIRKLKRWIIQVPVLTPRLSSYWLLLVTSTNFFLARSLVDSLKNNVICKDDAIRKILPKACISYEEAVIRAFDKIAQNSVISSWKDSISSGRMPSNFLEHIQSPKTGCWKMTRQKTFSKNPEKVYECFTQIGGKNGWYYMNWAWILRGVIDKLMGGTGLRRGRVFRKELRIGDTLDFWRVLLIDPKNYRLLLYAEMKLPGEAWLEFAISKKDGKHCFIQTATFRPLGLLGRIYWMILFPVHFFLFRGLHQKILQRSSSIQR